MNAILKEHAHQVTLSESVFYPDHPPRTESHVFVATKKHGHEQRIPCAISGQTEGVEYHHIFCEWAFTAAVDWQTVKDVGTGAITRLPVLDLHTDQPTGETYEVRHSLLWIICKLAELRGFNWSEFDPAAPETFVDSMVNMLVLHAKFHRQKGHGMHNLTLPVWIFQALPRIPGFVFTADELTATAPLVLPLAAAPQPLAITNQ